MKLCILHISDLHRTRENPISNEALMSSLQNDHRRYTQDELPSIKNPDLIVVSGDIIFGINNDCANPEQELDAQYDEAFDLLEKLTDHFLNGDRSKVVIVPGNHDISTYHVYQSIEKINIPDDDTKRNFVQQLFSSNSHLRWSWNALELFRIINSTTYNQRIEAFCKFYKKFYNSLREYSLTPEEQFDIFNYPDLNLSIVGFSSCHNNDILNKQGAINPFCIGTVNSSLNSTNHEKQIRIGVWHHNTEGIPMSFDYMDAEILQNLIDFGFSIGLHGHQHKPQFIDTRFKHGEDKLIKVISAGTLCGNPLQRFSRSYNLIELDTNALSGTLHIREMTNDNLQLPIWACKTIPPQNLTSLDFDFSPPPRPIIPKSIENSDLSKAQEYFDNEEYKEASTLFRKYSNNNGNAKRLLLECYYRDLNWALIIEMYNPPSSDTETIYLIEAYWEEDRKKELSELLNLSSIVNSTEPSIVELRNKYLPRL